MHAFRRATGTDLQDSARWSLLSVAVVGGRLDGGLKEREAFLVADGASDLKPNGAAPPFAT